MTFEADRHRGIHRRRRPVLAFGLALACSAGSSAVAAWRQLSTGAHGAGPRSAFRPPSCRRRRPIR
jgi:hypothetical protein